MTEKQYLTEFIKYKMLKNVFIKEVQIYLSKLSKKIAAIQLNMIKLFKLK